MNLDHVDSVEALSRALRERRTQAGFPGPAELANSVRHTRGSIARSTAYKVESGTERFSLQTMCSYLRACGADDAEIGTWHAPYERAMAASEVRGSRDREQEAIPTVKQLAEMGTEEAARVFGRIDVSEAADLLRRIEIKQAVVLLPEISPELSVTLLTRISRARRLLLFERIKVERGAELLAEMPVDSASDLLGELDVKRAGELLAAMPRGRATTLLDMSDMRRAVRLLVNIPADDAALLLGELDHELTLELLRTTPPSKAAQVLGAMDSEVAVQLLVQELSDERAVQLLSKAAVGAVRQLIHSMSTTVATRFMSKLSMETICSLFGHLSQVQHSELLEEILTPADAATVLTPWHLSEEFSVTVRDVRPARLAAIVGCMQPHERALTLACAGASCEVVLTLLPAHEAEQCRVELAPEKLAGHLAGVGPSWAVGYIHAMGVKGDEVLAVADSVTVAGLVRGSSDFDETARLLEPVRVEHVARALLTQETWMATGVLVSMRQDRAAAVLAAMSPELSHRMLVAIAEKAGERSYFEERLTAEEFVEVTAPRRKAAQLLRDAVEALRASRPNDPE